jgi:hypothetical protein
VEAQEEGCGKFSPRETVKCMVQGNCMITNLKTRSLNCCFVATTTTNGCAVDDRLSVNNAHQATFQKSLTLILKDGPLMLHPKATIIAWTPSSIFILSIRIYLSHVNVDAMILQVCLQKSRFIGTRYDRLVLKEVIRIVIIWWCDS